MPSTPVCSCARFGLQDARCPIHGHFLLLTRGERDLDAERQRWQDRTEEAQSQLDTLRSGLEAEVGRCRNFAASDDHKRPYCKGQRDTAESVADRLQVLLGGGER